MESKAYSLGEQVKKPDVTQFDEIHGDCLKAPKHGNGEKMTEEILVEYEDWFCDLCNQYQSLYAKPMYACQISVALHAAVGMATCATPDGRCAIRRWRMVPCPHTPERTATAPMP